MSRHFARKAGTASIALLSAVVVTVSTAAAAEGPKTSTVTFYSATQPQVLVTNNAVAATAPKAAKPAHKEFIRATSKKAKDISGYEPSLYRGKYYRSDQESFRRCVMDRESSFGYRAANGSSSARGAYQFLDNSWRDGLVHMMLSESRKTDDGLKKKIKSLRSKPIHHWNRYFQDRSWYTAMNFRGPWSGKHHWNATVPGTGC